MKVTTDACLFGAWVAEEVTSQESGVRSLLDIGSGTGLLSLMVAQKETEAKIDAIEIDKVAAEQAKTNAEGSAWKDRIQIINADVMAFPFNNKYDLVISNPPFYENELRSDNDLRNLAHHSKKLTLKDVLSLVSDHLKPDGHFFLLLPYKRNDEIRTLFKDHQFHVSKIIFVRQSLNHDYFRIMLKGKLSHQYGDETEIDEMSIWDDQQQYSPGFVALLKDYYLHL